MLKFLFLLLLIPLILISCKSDDATPDFIKLPSGIEALQKPDNVTVTQVPEEVIEKKVCFLQNYKGLNKLCGFGDFWTDFSSFMERWVTYKILLSIIGIIIAWLVIRKLLGMD